MANHKSALKRMRQNEKRRLHNRVYRTRVRTLIKRARAQIAEGYAEAAKDKTKAAIGVAQTDRSYLEAARAAAKAAIKDLDTAASRGTIHKRNAARRKSRLMKQLAALEAQS